MFLKRMVFIFKFLGRLLHVFWQIFYGVLRISKLKQPMVTIFGGSQLKKSDIYFIKAYELAARFVTNDISVLTGGGPGVMEAANCGANHAENAPIRSIGIGVEGLTEKPNNCTQEYFVLHYFFARKWLLTRFSSAFIVFPGGFGTLDELFEVLTLMQTEKMKPFPVVLFGVAYWTPLLDWIKAEPLARGLLHMRNMDLIIITDDIEEAFIYAKKECLTC